MGSKIFGEIREAAPYQHRNIINDPPFKVPILRQNNNKTYYIYFFLNIEL